MPLASISIYCINRLPTVRLFHSKPDRKLYTQQQAQAVLESKHLVIHENLSEYPTWCSFWYGYCRAAMHQVWYSPCIMWKSLGLGSHILQLTVNHPFSQAILPCEARLKIYDYVCSFSTETIWVTYTFQCLFIGSPRNRRLVHHD